MIKLSIVRANDDIWQGHGFIKDNLYFARQSKDGKQILVQDILGQWCSMVNHRWAKCWGMIKEYEENFTVVKEIFVKNWSELKKVTDESPYNY